MTAKKPKATDVLQGFEPTQDEIEFDEFLEEVGPSTAVIHILRMKPDGSTPQIGKTTMDQIREDPWEFLRSTYGGGKFRLLFRGGNREFRGSKVLEVEGSAVPTGQAGASGVLSHEKLLDTMLLSMIQHFQPREIPPPPPALDIGALFAGMASMMTVLKPAAPTEKPADPIQMFQTIMQMYQGMKDKNEKPPLEQLRDVASVIKEFSGDKGGGEDSMWGAVASIGKDVVEKGSQILGNMRQPAPAFHTTGNIAPFQPAKPTAQFPTLPAALPTTTEIPNQPAPGETAAAHSAVTLSNTEKWIRVQIGSLKEKAKLNKNPEFWAEYILDNEEDYGPAALLYAVRQGATLETLIAFDPEIGSNPQLTWWFSEVFEGVKAGLNQPMDSGRQGGDEGDDLPNVPARQPGPNGSGGSSDSRPVPDTDVN